MNINFKGKVFNEEDIQKMHLKYTVVAKVPEAKAHLEELHFYQFGDCYMIGIAALPQSVQQKIIETLPQLVIQ